MKDYERKALQGLSTTRIRRNQELTQQQIAIAHRAGNTNALERLREWENHYADEMYRRLVEGLPSPYHDDDQRLGGNDNPYLEH